MEVTNPELISKQNLLLGMTLGKSKNPYNSGMWIAPPFPLLCLCVIFHEPELSGTASTMSSFHQFPKPYLYFILICCLEENTEETQAVDNYCFPWLMCSFTEGWKEGRKGRKNKERERKLDNFREMSIYCFDNHKVTSWKWFILWQASWCGSSSLLPASFSTHVLPSLLVFNQSAASRGGASVTVAPRP